MDKLDPRSVIGSLARLCLAKSLLWVRNRPESGTPEEIVIGQTTKIRVLGSCSGSPGHPRDIRLANELIEVAHPARPLIADRNYDVNRFGAALRSPGRSTNHSRPTFYKRLIRCDERRYRGLRRIEAAFCRHKDLPEWSLGQLLVRRHPRCHLRSGSE